LKGAASEGKEYFSGFTARTVLAIVVVSLLFTPIQIYLQLVSGGGITSAAILMLIVFVELSSILGSPFTRQEGLVLYQMCVIATASGAGWINMVQRGYFVNSPLSWSFVVNSRPLPAQIPTWWAPPLESPAYTHRALIHIDYLPSIFVIELSWWIFMVGQIALTILLSYLYIEVERLPFPMSTIDATLVSSVTEKESQRLKWFTLSMYPGIMWGGLLYFPFLFGGVQILPIPWADFTLFTAAYMPGAMWGIATDIVNYGIGIMLPLSITLNMLIGSISIWIVGNNLLLTTFTNLVPMWAQEFYYGMGLGAIQERSSLRIWAVPQVGFSLALVVFLMITGGKTILKGLKYMVSVVKVTGEERQIGVRYPSLYLLLGLYVASAAGSTVFAYLIVPDFPFWITFLVIIGFNFIGAVLFTYTYGVTGTAIAIPNLWNITVYLSGYGNVQGWFSPVFLAGSTYVGGVKSAYLTKTNPMNYIKALIFTSILIDYVSLFYVDFFWKIAPIPSSVYPFTVMNWPISIINTNVWISRQVGLQPEFLYYPFFITLGLFALGEAIRRFSSMPFSAPGLVAGMFTPPPYVFPLVIGSTLGRYLFPRLFGEKTWSQARPIVVAGIFSGVGIVVGAAVGAALIAKAVWLLPW